MDLLLQLSQFVLRLAFGMALGMALVSPRHVTSGYFRNTSYVVLGLAVLATLICFSEGLVIAAWLSGVAAFLSYACSVMWMYEKAIVGRALLVFVALLALQACWISHPSVNRADRETPTGESREHATPSPVGVAAWCRAADAATGGAVLGFTMAAMLLGHWYLNSPTMQIAPLVRLLAWMAAALVARALLAAWGLAWEWQQPGVLDGLQWAFLAIRWLSGIVAPLLLAWMAWRTLKIPNTQSATGILYVAVITTFTGELAAQLLSAEARYPL